MPRYIDADIVLPKILYRERTYGCFKKIYSKVIKDAPTADVRPERHGEWIFGEFNGVGTPVWCSECGERTANVADFVAWRNYPGHKYCGRCGAKMDGEDGESNE